MGLNKNTAKVVIEGLGEATLQQMDDMFQAALKKEYEGTGKAFDQNYFPPEYNKALDTFHKETLEMVETMITENVQSEVLKQSMEESVNRVYMEHTPFNSLNEGAWGTFLEQKMFGAAGDDRPTADIDTFRREILPMEKRVEVKSKIKQDTIETQNPIDVGAITVYGIGTLTDIEKQTLKNIVLLYKMMIKMQNFLYLAIVNKTFPSGRQAIGFRAMVLYTTLYLQGLQKMMANVPGWGGTVQVKKDAPKLQDDKITYKQHYDIKLEIASITKDLFGGIDRIAKIYMRHTNMIDEIHSGGISARAFFARLKKLEGFMEID